MIVPVSWTEVYDGRGSAILVATGVTALIAFFYGMWGEQVNEPTLVMVGFIAVVFVGLPAFLGITLLMIPIDQFVRPRLGALASLLVTAGANVLLVATLGLWLDSHRGNSPLVLYLLFAALAVLIWRASDLKLRRSFVA